MEDLWSKYLNRNLAVSDFLRSFFNYDRIEDSMRRHLEKGNIIIKRGGLFGAKEIETSDGRVNISHEQIRGFVSHWVIRKDGQRLKFTSTYGRCLTYLHIYLSK